MWVILSVIPGVIVGGVIAYVVAWILVPAEPTATPTPAEVRRLRRSATDRKMAGVCGGLAEYFGIDSTIVRIAAVVLAIYPGAVICGVLVYLLAWLVIPSAAAERFEPLPSTPLP
jgi:phage shock protein PspC (stress-responsive transcriptional regulator)